MGGKVAQRALPGLRADLSDGWSEDLVDEADIADGVLVGDFSGRDASDVVLTGCRIEDAQLVGAALRHSHLTDCVVTACDLSGLVLAGCVCTRVEFRDCRLSGLQAASSRFRDVGFFGCRMDGANFRMTTWERAEFEACDLVDADFYAAVLPASRFLRCDLSDVQLAKSSLTGSRLHASTLDRLKGADALRGVTISGDAVLPVALALFSALEMTVDDGP